MSLCAGGMPFGVKFYTDGVTVVGFCDVESETGKVNPAAEAGLKQKDVILKVNGEVLAGAPGELKGYFNAGKVGSLLGNGTCGVWGVFSELPEEIGEPMPIGLRNELEEGDAYILSTLDSNKVEQYDVKISNVNRDADGPKCFTVTVTDPDLLAVSGGIVQGMGV